MPYKTIFEIGPIFDYIKSTRKTRDLWGGSFLFSYIMGVAARLILEEEIPGFKFDAHQNAISKIIKRPGLKNDLLFRHCCDTIYELDEPIRAGSIPDRMYCVLSNVETPENVKHKLIEKLYAIFKKSFTNIKNNGDTLSEINHELVHRQITDYFRIFYAIGDHNNSWIELENAISSRGDIFEFSNFEDRMNETTRKDEKCSLCGDRKNVIVLKNSRRNNRSEYLCAICTIKRGLLGYFLDEERNIVNERFSSTTDIAAIVPKKIMKDSYELLKHDITDFAKAHFSKPDSLEVFEARDDLGLKSWYQIFELAEKKEVIDHLSYQLYFSEYKSAKKLKNILKDLATNRTFTKESLINLPEPTLDSNKIAYEFRAWIDRPFYAIIALDGDDMGKILSLAQENESLTEKLSNCIHTYTQETNKVLEKYNGQLIFCGGEDTLAIVHPLYLMDVVKELFAKFRDSFRGLDVDTINPDELSISAGAIISHHKYPLSLAISGAHDMLDNAAKKQRGKASLAIRLIKGGSERCDFICKINQAPPYSLYNFEKLIGQSIPRGFVYKLIEDRDILEETVTTSEDMLKYLLFLYKKNRSEKPNTEAITSALQDLVKIFYEDLQIKDKYSKLINHLYFARFMEGGE